MKAIEKATKTVDDWEEAVDKGHSFRYPVEVGITAFLDGILEDPEAMERVEKQTPGYVGMTIAALKQEVER